MGSGSVDDETVTLWRSPDADEYDTARDWHFRLPACPQEGCASTEFVPLSRVLRAERERDEAREVSHSRLRDRARLVRRAERAEADLDLLTRRFALVDSRSGVRAQALQLAEECISENVANGEGVDSQPAVLDAIVDALKYEIADEPDNARPGAKPPSETATVDLEADRDRLSAEVTRLREAIQEHRRKTAVAFHGASDRALWAALSPGVGEDGENTADEDWDRWSAANCESCHRLGRPCGVHMALGGGDRTASGGQGVRDVLREEFVVCRGYPDPYEPTPNTYEKALEFQRENGGRIKRRVSSLWEWVGEMVECPRSVRDDDSEAGR